MKKLLVLSLVFFAFAFTAKAQTVYASEKGEKYHTADCKLSGDAVGMKLLHCHCDLMECTQSPCQIERGKSG